MEIDFESVEHTPTALGKYVSEKSESFTAPSTVAPISTLAECEALKKDVMLSAYAKYLADKNIIKFDQKTLSEHVQRAMKVAKLFTFKYPDDPEGYKTSRDKMLNILFAYDQTSAILCIFFLTCRDITLMSRDVRYMLKRYMEEYVPDNVRRNRMRRKTGSQ
jgi:hypothetical protein